MLQVLMEGKSMSSEPGLDFSELDKFIEDLGGVPVRLTTLLEIAVGNVASQVKFDWRAEARRLNKNRSAFYPKSISLSMMTNDAAGNRGEVVAEVGPVPGRSQGSLGILEDAPGGVMSRPQRNVDRALKKNSKSFEKQVLDAGEKAIGG